MNKELHDRIADFEGSRAISEQEVLALEALFLEWAHLTASNTRKNANKYVAKKAAWLVQRELPESALHALWVYVHYAIGDLLRHKEKEEAARVLAQRWLEAVKWDNEATLQKKGAMAQSLLEELAVLAADLPPG